MTRAALFTGLVVASLMVAVANAQPAGRGPQCGVFEESHGSITVTSVGSQFSIPQLTSEGRFRGVGPVFGCWVEIGKADDVRSTFTYGYRVTEPGGASKEYGPSGIEIGGSGATGLIPVPIYKPPTGTWRVEFYTIRREGGARASLGSVSFTMTDSAASPTQPSPSTPPTSRPGGAPPPPPGGSGKQTLGSVLDTRTGGAPQGKQTPSTGGSGPRCGVFEESGGRITVVSSGTQFSIPQLTSEGRLKGVGPVFGCWVEIGTADDFRAAFSYGYRVTDPVGQSVQGRGGIQAGGSGATGLIEVLASKQPAGAWTVEFYTIRNEGGARASLGSVSFTMTGGASPQPPPISDTFTKQPPTPPTPVAPNRASGVLFEDRFARPDADTPGADWTEYTLRGAVAQQQDSPWRISGNTLRYEATGRGVYWEDFVETTATFPVDNVRVEFELRGQASTSQGYVGPTVFLSGEGRFRGTAQNVSSGLKQVGVAAWYRYDNQGTRGVIVAANGSLRDHADAVFAGVNEPAFAKHVLTIRNGTLTYEAPGFPMVSSPLGVAAGERRHLTFGVRLYDSSVPQVVEIKNVKVTALGDGGTMTTGGGQPLAAGTILARQNVPASGGRIEVQRPGDALNGLTIDVPAGAYTNARQFTVSSKPAPIDAATPIITVENGGGYADTPMTVRIPVQIGPDQFAMGFFYDETSGKLEGMPLVDEDANSVTVETRHFSSFLVMAALVATLPAVVDTGFRPGIDDWQMINRGSVIEPNGHCAGQSISSMWYYYEKRLNGAPALYGLYDHNAPGFRTHPTAKTPGFWGDDSLALRFVSTVQNDIVWDSNWAEKALAVAKQRHDELMFNAFRLTMSLAREPQLVGILRQTGTEWAGHALVAYRIENSRLYVADPNYPGDRDERGRIVDRVIDFDAATLRFQPYMSGPNAGALGKAYPHISFVAKSALVDWNKIGSRWSEFANSFNVLPSEDEKLIGHDRFPKYQLALSTEGFKPGTNQPMADDMTIDQPQIEVRATGVGPLKVSVIQDGRTSVATPGKTFVLKAGQNSMGFLIETAAGKWVDYKDYNIWVGEAAQPQEESPCGSIVDKAAAAGLSWTDYYRAHPAAPGMDTVLCGCPVDVSDLILLTCLEQHGMVPPQNMCAGLTVENMRRGDIGTIKLISCSFKCPGYEQMTDAQLRACMAK